MRLAQVRAERGTVRDLAAFGGLNWTDGTHDGELAACENLSTRRAPYLATRSAREVVAQYENADAYYRFDGHTVVCANGRLLFDGEDKGEISRGEKQFAVVGATLCIFPDKLTVNVQTGEVKPFAPPLTVTGATYESGKITAVDAKFSEHFDVGDIVDLSGTPLGLYDRRGLEIAAVDKNSITFTREAFPIYCSPQTPIYIAQAQEEFLPDPTCTFRYGVQARGYTYEVFNASSTRIPKGALLVLHKFNDHAREAVCSMWLPDGRGDGVLLGTDSNAFRLGNQTRDVGTAQRYTFGEFTLQKATPHLDFICEHQNRLWGVCNAQDNAIYDEKTQTFSHVTSRVIYASELGEPTKFYQYDGTASDSYALAIAGEGDFTAICSYSGAVLAFKERKLHKILGGYPAEYYLTSRDFDGVKQGCAKSLAVIGGDLYYKGVRGVYRYSGGAAACVSKKLGEFPCEGVGGTDGRRYYLSADEGLYVLDTQSLIWLREDGAHVTDFAGNEMLVGDTVFRIGTGAADANTPFSAEFAPFGERDGFAELRYVRLSLEVEIGKGAYLAVEVRTDGAWRTVGTAPSGTVGVTVLRLPPMRCGEMRLRLSGRGDVAVRSLRRQYLKRSDRAS